MRPLRALPADLGRFRVANYVFRWRFDGTSRTATTRLSDGTTLALNLGDWPQAQAFLTGEYDRPTVDFIGAHLPLDGIFVEVGAHVGLVTFQVLRQVPSAQVHAFEPHPDRGAQFDRNIVLNGAEGQVRLNRVGLSNSEGTVGFDLDSHKITDDSETVSVAMLDNYLVEHGIDTVDVMKLDVEGHELQALQGAERALSAKRIKAITLEAMEVHGDTDGPRELLESFGYRRVPVTVKASPLRRVLGKQFSSPNEAYVI